MRSEPSWDSRTAFARSESTLVGDAGALEIAGRHGLAQALDGAEQTGQVCHVLGHLREVRVDEAHGIVDLVGHARRQLSHRRQLLRLQDLPLELLDPREVLEEHDRTEAAALRVQHRRARHADG
jgi:hypothetical protein